MPLNEGYGLSEASPVTHSTPHAGLRKPGTIGLPMPDTDMKIVDLETGTRELPLGEEGELCIAGPQVMKGYWNRPDETAHRAAHRRRRRVWLHTGDVARIDEDGYTYIVQRKKDMIIVDGFNVYPSEVEAVLYAHPAVMACAAIGVPDGYHGEVVKACVVLKPDQSATAGGTEGALRDPAGRIQAAAHHRDPRQPAEDHGRQGALHQAAHGGGTTRIIPAWR